MLMVADIGNTDTVIGIYDGDRLQFHWRLSSAGRTSDEQSIFFNGLLASAGRSPQDIDGAVIASVVPRAERVWRDAITACTGITPYVIGEGGHPYMKIELDRPDEVGADRIVNSVAAVEKYGAPVISVDLGTAITFDVVSADGAYLGGAIAPGLGSSVETLFSRTAKLPQVDLVRPERAIGKNTAQAIQSGIIFGYVGLVDSLVERIFGELGTRTRVVATGGHSSLVARDSLTITDVEPWLTLDGLYIIHEKWLKDRS